MIENLNTVIYSTIFIVPGYILYSTIESLIPRSKNGFFDSAMKFLTATLSHYVIWSLPILYMFNKQLYDTNILLFYILSIVIIFISPSIIGLIIVKTNKHKIVMKVLQIFGYNPINPIPTSWDYIFSDISNKTWVIVTLKNQKIFHGKFSSNSFASSFSMERDIYIEDVYTIDKDESWIRRKQNNGVLILKDEIQSIEFFHND